MFTSTFMKFATLSFLMLKSQSLCPPWRTSKPSRSQNFHSCAKEGAYGAKRATSTAIRRWTFNPSEPWGLPCPPFSLVGQEYCLHSPMGIRTFAMQMHRVDALSWYWFCGNYTHSLGNISSSMPAGYTLIPLLIVLTTVGASIGKYFHLLKLDHVPIWSF